MTKVEDAIRDRIRRDGPITVGEYMAMALGDPEDGYYRRADPLGAAGDFITAPEISQVFGELVGAWSVVTWLQMGAPSPFRLVELGPGRGTLMADALRAARTAPNFLAAADLHLVETSPALRAAQRDALAARSPSWHDSVDAVPDGPAIFIANEFFDALPVEQFVRAADGWRRRRIGLADDDNGALCFVVGEAADGMIPFKYRLAGAPTGSVFEMNPAARGCAAHLGERIAMQGGAALIVDYGHVKTAAGDTMQAVFRHRYHDPLASPGQADLTAHVDFEALADAAQGAGVAVHGPVSQADFLRRLGIETRADRLVASARPDQAPALRWGVRRLVAPDQMGELFKVLCLAAPGLPVPAGFEHLLETAPC